MALAPECFSFSKVVEAEKGWLLVNCIPTRQWSWRTKLFAAATMAGRNITLLPGVRVLFQAISQEELAPQHNRKFQLKGTFLSRVERASITQLHVDTQIPVLSPKGPIHKKYKHGIKAKERKCCLIYSLGKWESVWVRTVHCFIVITAAAGRLVHPSSPLCWPWSVGLPPKTLRVAAHVPWKQWPRAIASWCGGTWLFTGLALVSALAERIAEAGPWAI